MKSATKMEKLSAGYASWRWLSSINLKQREWFLGALRKRGGYEAWSVHLAKGLQDPQFLSQFESEPDGWLKSKLVGTRIAELSATFAKMSNEQRQELGKQGEVELRSGLALMNADKKVIQELLAIVDPPTA